MFSVVLIVNLSQAGTEDGYVNVIRIHEDGLVHEKLLDKQQGTLRLLYFVVIRISRRKS